MDLYEVPDVLDGVTVGEHWLCEPDNGRWRCGELGIALEGTDPTSYYLYKLDSGDVRLSGGRIPPSGGHENEFGWFTMVLVHNAFGAEVPTDGLETWFDLAQELADEEYERLEDLERQAREEWERGRVGRIIGDLLSEIPSETDWLIPGVLPRGWAAKIAGREKMAGKGTLVFYLLSRLEQGRDTVFGPTSRPVSATILTEEPEESVREKAEAFGLRRARLIFGYELAGKKWDEKVACLVAEALADGHELIFVDNVSRSAGIEDEGGVELGRAVEKLQDKCRSAGISLIVDHHHKKGRDRVENRSRGGTALPGAVDVNIEVEQIGGLQSRTRKLTSLGRLRALNWVRTIELNEDGTDYTEVDNVDDTDTGELQLMIDAETLRRHGPVTVKQFKALIGKSDSVARRRLKALADVELATQVVGEMTSKGRTAATFVARPSVVSEPCNTTDATDGSEGTQGPS